MSDDLDVPALPGRSRENSWEEALDVELPAPGGNQVQRARAGLYGPWEPGNIYERVNWLDDSSFDASFGEDWDDAYLLDD